MGNQQSNHARLTNGALQSPAAASTSTLDEDGHSMDSVVRSPKLKPSKHAPRQSSLNLLKKKGGPHASKVPKDLTTTVIEVPRAATAPNLDLVGDGDAYEVTEEGGIENDKFRHAKTLSSPSPTYPAPGGSPDTITEKSATRPISAGTTVSACSARRLDPIDGGRDSSSPYLRVSALSPTLPAPPPVPEDSPHKYGLKDNMETPEPPSPPLELDAVKARRRSSGIEIFNEAKSLQSASSFLNGLSTARRRAESRAQSRGAIQNTAHTGLTSASATCLPYANVGSTYLLNSANRSLSYLPIPNPPSPASSTSSRPITPTLDDLSRTLGHTHKSSGFAYAKPLSIVQLRCFRGHDRLLRSGNTHYPVECAVCHRDDGDDFYWSCSWCAVRMCGDCRGEFRQKGVTALKERIRRAEMGARAA